MSKVCPICGDTFRAYVSQHRKSCSRECAAKAQSGARSRTWRGGYGRKKGYLLRYVGRDHPMANVDGYVYEHRLVMAEHLGRMLTRDEHVHHRNEDRTDNRIENLELTDAARHMSHHRRIERWAEQHDACVECGGTDRPHAGGGLCRRCYGRAYNRAWNAKRRAAA